MPEKTAGEYTNSYVQREVESDFYSAKFIGFEYIEADGRVGQDGKPFGDSYKLIWEVPDAGEDSMWDYVSARFGSNKKTGLPNPLQATVNALNNGVIDTTSAPYNAMTVTAMLEPHIGTEIELYIEPITTNGVTRNKITKRRAFKTRGATAPASSLETTNIQSRI